MVNSKANDLSGIRFLFAKGNITKRQFYFRQRMFLN